MSASPLPPPAPSGLAPATAPGPTELLLASWPEVRRRVARMGPFYAVAVVAPDGSPNVVPIGSLLLGAPGEGFCFEIFVSALARAGEGARCCVLAVETSPLFWLQALARGRFAAAPAYRLDGVLGPRRRSTATERARWQRRVRLLRWLPGYRPLWGRLDHVRELRFTALRPARLGRLTAGLATHRGGLVAGGAGGG